MGSVFLLAIGIMLVLEGVLPTLAPKQWQATMAQLAQLPSKQIRVIGLGSLAVGLLLIYMV